MNLHVPPSGNGRTDMKALRVMVEEKEEIIQMLRKQLGLIKTTLMENTIQTQEMSKELLSMKEELATAKSDAERWKIEAFNSVQYTAGPEEVRASPIYQDLESKLSQLQLEKQELTIKHAEELREREELVREELSKEYKGTIDAANDDTMRRITKKDKRIKELEEKVEQLRSELESKTKKDHDEKDDRSTYDNSAIHMLEQQLRQAEEHVLEQSELYQRTVMQLELEIDRRNKCRKCRKLARNDES